MKTLILSALAFIGSKAAFSQPVTLADFNLQRQKTNKTGLLVLGSWSVANILYGGIAASQANGTAKYFHRMNVFWNIVNLGVASAGYFTARNEAELNYAASLKRQNAVEKIFLLNAGLDVAYIAGGLYLKEKGNTSPGSHDKYKGYGESIMLQGGALFLFDAIMYAINNRHGGQLYKIAEKVELTATENGLGVQVRL